MKQELNDLFKIFRQHGKQLFIVGGAVRDMLLGGYPEDYDLSTDALPEEMEAWFEHVITIGKHFGTIGVVLGEAVFEITTFRKESDYKDKRHPDYILFTDNVREDIERRDFTVNGLLLDENGCIIDYVGGLKDIEQGLLRCIGNPEKRFEEDRLRKWRCIRLAAEKKMEIATDTRSALESDVSIEGVSMERIWSELTRIILAEKVTWGGYLLCKTGLYNELLRKIVPGYAKRNEEYLIEGFEIMGYLPIDLPMRLATLVLPMFEQEREDFFKTLHCPNKVKRLAIKYCCYFLEDSDDIVGFKKALCDMGSENAQKLLTFQRGISEWENDRSHLLMVEKNERAYEKIKANHEPLTVGDLNISGNDLKKLGYDGSDIGSVLEQLMAFVYKNPEANEKDRLIACLEREKNGETNLPKSN